MTTQDWATEAACHLPVDPDGLASVYHVRAGQMAHVDVSRDVFGTPAARTTEMLRQLAPWLVSPGHRDSRPRAEPLRRHADRPPGRLLAYSARMASHDELATRLADVQLMVHDLAKAHGASAMAETLAEPINREIELVRCALHAETTEEP